MKNEILYSVKAQRGPTLRCKGWKQESLLRLLENNMENAERPERLVIYGGIGKCARNWESYHAIVDALINLENDETLAIQSGMPVAILVHQSTPERVVRFLADHLELRPYQIFPVDGRVCMGDLMELYALDRRDLKDVPFTPALPGDLAKGESFAEVLRWRDQLLFHPYDSFSPVVDFLTWAARDPQVLAIAQGDNEAAIGRLKRCLETEHGTTGYEELRAFCTA